MFFRDPIKHERGQKFEEWQQTTDRALRRPSVQQELGQLGLQIIELNQTAFLPNVRHSEVRVPSSYLRTGCIGILPYLKSDDKLRPHDTLLQPTPARKERIQKALGHAGVDNSKRALNEFVQQAIGQIREEEKLAFVNPRRHVSGGAPSHYDAGTAILVTSRPLVVPKWQDVPLNRVLRGAIGAHELIHTFDIEELMEEPDMWYRARTELRGHRVGAIIAEDGIASGGLTRWRYGQDDNITIEVEAIRKDYEIDSDALLSGAPLDDNNPAPLHMAMMGII